MNLTVSLKYSPRSSLSDSACCPPRWLFSPSSLRSRYPRARTSYRTEVHLQRGAGGSGGLVGPNQRRRQQLRAPSSSLVRLLLPCPDLGPSPARRWRWQWGQIDNDSAGGSYSRRRREGGSPVRRSGAPELAVAEQVHGGAERPRSRRPLVGEHAKPDASVVFVDQRTPPPIGLRHHTNRTCGDAAAESSSPRT
jgi:hypothetical protein